MEASQKMVCVLGLLVAFGIASLGTVRATDECAGKDPNDEAMKLWPCAGAAQNKNKKVPAECCSAVEGLLKTDPRCLCAVMLSDTAKESGINLKVAITIPQRCNIADRPKGKKCGDYTLP